jgi:hypothetical protein
LRSGITFIAELEVVQTNNEEWKEGDSCSWIRSITNHKEMALGDIKAFLAACANVKEEEVDNAGAEEAVGESQPFAGKLIACEAFDRPMKKDPTQMFTHTRWSYAA